MKKKRKILLTAAIVLSLAVCGGGSCVLETEAAETQTESKSEEPAAESDVVHHDLSQEYSYSYEEGAITLLETENVRLTAKRLKYEDSSALKQEDAKDGMILRLSVRMENLTGGDITVLINGAGGSISHMRVNAGEAPGRYITGPLYDWNGLIGETEDCFQSVVQLQFTNEEGEVVDQVQFDWYSSEKTPFVNILTGDAVDFQSVSEREPGNTGSASENAAAGEEEQTYTLMFATHFQEQTEDPGLSDSLRDYFTAIETATDGHVKTDAYYNGLVFSRNEMYEALRSGMVDMGIISLSDLPDSALLANVVSLPLQGFDDGIKATEAMWALVRESPEAKAQLEAQEVKILQLFAYAPMILKPAQDFSMDDLQGKGCVFALCFNKESWNMLPEKYRKAIENLSGYESSLKFAEAAVTNNLLERKQLEDMMLTLLDPSDEMYAQVQDACNAYAAQWADLVTAATGIDGTAFLEQTKAMYSIY